MERETSYPIILTKLGHVRCIIIGGGDVAERKAGELLASGACPLVISPELTPTLAGWAAAGTISHLGRGYQAGDLDGAFLVIAATNNRTVNAAIAEEAAQVGALANIADSPDSGTFHTVATVRRGELLLTVSTGGASPMVAARIRRDLEASYGEEYGMLLALLRRFRGGPLRDLSPEKRAGFWQRLSLDALLGWLAAGVAVAAEHYLERQVARAIEER
jgi:precorrin-2 dehydrogenase/sirohydrochlorin ferrochelatase